MDQLFDLFCNAKKTVFGEIKQLINRNEQLWMKTVGISFTCVLTGVPLFNKCNLEEAFLKILSFTLCVCLNLLKNTTKLVDVFILF